MLFPYRMFLVSVPSHGFVKQAEVEGVHMSYRIAGSREPVVLLHRVPEPFNTRRKIATETTGSCDELEAGSRS